MRKILNQVSQKNSLRLCNLKKEKNSLDNKMKKRKILKSDNDNMNPRINKRS